MEYTRPTLRRKQEYRSSLLSVRNNTLAASHAAPGESRCVCAASSIEVRKKTGRTDARPLHCAYRWTLPA